MELNSTLTSNFESFCFEVTVLTQTEHLGEGLKIIAYLKTILIIIF